METPPEEPQKPASAPWAEASTEQIINDIKASKAAIEADAPHKLAREIDIESLRTGWRLDEPVLTPQQPSTGWMPVQPPEAFEGITPNRAQRRAAARRAPSLVKLGDSINTALDGPMKGDDLSSMIANSKQKLLVLHSYDPRDVREIPDGADPATVMKSWRIVDYAYVRTDFGWTFAGARDGVARR